MTMTTKDNSIHKKLIRVRSNVSSWTSVHNHNTTITARPVKNTAMEQVAPSSTPLLGETTTTTTTTAAEVFGGAPPPPQAQHQAAAAAAPAAPENNDHSRHGNNNNDNNNNGSTNNNRRVGTTASARFNILSTMVGGGSLSIPLAFQKTGNGLLAPLLLLCTACLTQFTFDLLIHSSRALSAVSASTAQRGNVTFENMTAAAFGPKAFCFSAALVTLMCFFGTVGYAVLLRDMMQPIADYMFQIPEATAGIAGPSKSNNLTMWSIVLLVTPLCALQTLTSLQRFGALSMLSVLVVGMCIVYRSGQCLQERIEAGHDWTESFELWPRDWKQVLNAFPLYISVYVCHYNILTVHNELRAPSASRVSWWLQSTTWTATLFYLTMGLAGSAYASCTPSGQISGNVLLDFDEKDPLLLVGRLCLAITITLAFPMLTIPARDILIRAWCMSASWRKTWTWSSVFCCCCCGGGGGVDVDDEPEQTAVAASHVPFTLEATTTTTQDEESNGSHASLQKPLLSDEETAASSLNNNHQEEHHDDHLRASDDSHHQNGNGIGNHQNGHNQNPAPQQNSGNTGHQQQPQDEDEVDPAASASFATRLGVAMLAFYAAAAVASCVQSIDVVWDLLGSSLSILLCQLIPCASYLGIMRLQYIQQAGQAHAQKLQKLVAVLILVLFIPLALVSTANAVYNTFLDKKK
jgi:amino acid permease